MGAGIFKLSGLGLATRLDLGTAPLEESHCLGAISTSFTTVLLLQSCLGTVEEFSATKGPEVWSVSWGIDCPCLVLAGGMGIEPEVTSG